MCILPFSLLVLNVHNPAYVLKNVLVRNFGLSNGRMVVSLACCGLLHGGLM